MFNIKMIVTYDGAGYKGWQKTPLGRSIEGILQDALERILRHKVSLQAASRTDAGVHAEGQVVNFFTSNELDLTRFQHSLNCMLPRDIAIKEMSFAAEAFHPTLDCMSKEYRYFLCYQPVQLPHERFYAWHVPLELDVASMRTAASLLTGTHDFSAFCNFRKQMQYEHFVRTVDSIDIIELGDRNLCFKICGNNFLYKMVRNLVGTLVYVGMRKIACDAVQSILASRDRTQAGITAPAHGLRLHRVLY